MALPQTIGTSLELHNNGYAGPFRASNGDHYVILQDLTNKDRIACFKADNGDNTWTRLDTSNDPISSTVNDYQGLTATLSGTVIHIASWGSSGSNRYVFYHNFDTSTDTWGTANEAVAGPFSTNTGDGSCSIEVRSDGDKVIFYQGPYEAIHTSNYDRIYYAVHQGTAWTDASGFFNAGENKQYRFVYSIKGASDKCHIFYSNENQTEVYHASLDSSNTASSAELVTSASSVNPTTRPFYYDDGGAETVVIAVAESGTAYRYSVVNDGTPGGGQSVSGATTYQPFTGGHYAIGIAADANTGQEYLAYVDSATQDLWYDVRVSGSWGTDTEVLDAITGKRLCINVFTIDNGDTVLAYVYNDNDTIKYHETVIEVASSDIVLGAVGAVSATGTAALSIGHPLAASGAVSATGTAGLSVDRPLAAAGSVSASGTAALSIGHPLAASGAVTASGTAGLSVDRSLSAAGSVSASGTAGLSVDRPLAAAGSVSASGTAGLSVDRVLAASGAVSATGTAGLSVDRPLAAAGSVSASGTAGLSVDRPLAAAGAVSVSGTAGLSVDRVLAAAGDVVVTGTASLTVSAPGEVSLAASGSVTVTATAGLSVDRPLAAAGSVSATGTAGLSVDRVLAAAGAVSVSGTAGLSVDRVLAAAGDVVVTGTAELSVDAAGEIVLAAVGSVTVTATAGLSVDRVLAASGAVTVSGSAALTLIGTVLPDDDRVVFPGAQDREINQGLDTRILTSAAQSRSHNAEG